MPKGGFVYILTNCYNRVLYIGVTSNLHTRILEHRNKVFPNSFTSRYELYKLVYFEEYMSIESAIKLEKQLKAGSRNNKLNLINEKNPFWSDLAKDWF